MMGGMAGMLKSMGIDPDAIKQQADALVAEAAAMREEIARQGRVIDATARAHGVNPRDFDIAPTKEIEHG